MRDLLEQLPFLVFQAFLAVVACVGHVLIRRQDRDRRSLDDPLVLHIGDDFVELPANSSPREIRDILMIMQGHTPETPQNTTNLNRKE
jgi:hypothetical protein